MNEFRVQSIQINAPKQNVYQYISMKDNLTEWAQAFSSVQGDTAQLRTPQGEIDIGLEAQCSEHSGSIDWYMRFPDGSMAVAYSRVMELDGERSIYSFTLTPPPVPLEQLEGALTAQSKILAEELKVLKAILEQKESAA